MFVAHVRILPHATVADDGRITIGAINQRPRRTTWNPKGLRYPSDGPDAQATRLPGFGIVYMQTGE